MTGRVNEVLVNPGATVTAGQVLAVLEADDLQTRLGQARIELEKAELHHERAVSQHADTTELRLLTLDIEKHRLTVQALERQYEQTRLTAPFGGRLEVLSINPGQQVQAFAIAAMVVDPQALEVTGTTSGDSTKLQVGQKLDLVFTQLGRDPLSATLVSLPTMGPGGQAQPARFELDTPEPRLEMGMRGSGVLYLQKRDDVLLVPNQAIRRFGGGTFLQVLDGEARRDVPITIGLVGEVESEVLSGVEEGVKVVIGQ